MTWVIAAALALLVAGQAAPVGATTQARGTHVQAKLVGVWHKKLTKAEWDRVGVSRDVGVFTIVVERTGKVTVYRPGTYHPECSFCADDFETTIVTAGARLMLGSVPVCSFKGTYAWTVAQRTLTLKPTADKKCPVRETFFGGRWKR